MLQIHIFLIEDSFTRNLFWAKTDLGLQNSSDKNRTNAALTNVIDAVRWGWNHYGLWVFKTRRSSAELGRQFLAGKKVNRKFIELT